jgi:hypothetical protein
MPASSYQGVAAMWVGAQIAGGLSGTMTVLTIAVQIKVRQQGIDHAHDG